MSSGVDESNCMRQWEEGPPSAVDSAWMWPSFCLMISVNSLSYFFHNKKFIYKLNFWLIPNDKDEMELNIKILSTQMYSWCWTVCRAGHMPSNALRHLSERRGGEEAQCTKLMKVKM